MKHSFVVQTSWLLKPAKVRVTIHDTKADLEKATGMPMSGGVCQSWEIFHIDDDGKERQIKDGRVICHIHLHHGGLTVGVVSHEIAHAALHIFRTYAGTFKHAKIQNDNDKEEDSDEEKFAYTIGDLTSKVYNHLWKHEIIK